MELNPKDLHWHKWTGFNEYIRKCFKDGKPSLSWGAKNAVSHFVPIHDMNMIH